MKWNEWMQPDPMNDMRVNTGRRNRKRNHTGIKPQGKESPVSLRLVMRPAKDSGHQ
jgi:hypothetical protein